MTCINQRKKEHVRSVIFRRQHITRKELLEVTGYNWRSIVRYADELKSQGLIVETQASGEKPGRPTVMFHSNSEKVFFIGLTLVECKVYLLAMDINGTFLRSSQLDLPDEDRNSTMLVKLGAAIDNMCGSCSDMALTGLGFNSCLYHQRRRQMTAFRKMSQQAQNRYCVPVVSADNDSFLLHHLYRVNSLSGRAVGVVVGEELRLAEIDDGRIADTMGNYVRKLQEWCIAPECQGMNGDGYVTLEKVLSDESRVRRYCGRAGIGVDSSLLSSREILHLAEEGDAIALEVLRFDALLLARLVRRIHLDRKPDHLFLSCDNHLLQQELEYQCEKLSGEVGVQIRFCNCSISDGMSEVVDMIRSQVLYSQRISM